MIISLEFLQQEHIKELNRYGLLWEYLIMLETFYTSKLVITHEKENFLKGVADICELDRQKTLSVLTCLKNHCLFKGIGDNRYRIVEPLLFSKEEQEDVEMTWQEMVDFICREREQNKQYNDWRDDIPFDTEQKD